METVKILKYFAGGQWIESKTGQYRDIYDPSTGEITALAPCCTSDEVDFAVQSAKNAFPSWSAVPVMRRVQVLYKLRELLISHQEQLTRLVAYENGKALNDAEGDVLKAKEATEVAINAPALMMGQSLVNTSAGIDTVRYREPLGVFAGIVPFNFPAMIPMGWMTPLCIAAGNTIVIKASSSTPQTCMEIARLYAEAGLPGGVINIITCSKNENEFLIAHPDVKGISFVGSTAAGLSVYSKAAGAGKRVQALCEAKNHALVLEDAPVDRAAAGIINAAFGCAGERCMALPVVVVQESIADELVASLIKRAKALKIGPAYHKDTDMGPVVSKEHKNRVTGWIDKGIAEGAALALDGRDCKIKGFENGFYLGPTILDYVKPGMTAGDCEIFGPVLCVKRVAGFEQGLELMNQNQYANGSVIYTQNGYYAREFQIRTHGGMVGVNVGIPVPVGYFPFCGHKRSFFGDLHCLGTDGMNFYTESKCVTARWFDEEEMKREKVDSWDGTI
ncbi:MAG: CoA-acylating methylmalonate-semialdehyde dehydrogenase [Oscillospiraceae bacterium]|nr:CoA-acylating methylmalonate-semialdehyde dehydrogenase [Oscillospiraceae bacterium]